MPLHMLAFVMYGNSVSNGIVPPAEAIPNETTAIMKALELDSTNAVVQYSLADMRTWGLWDWKGGESAYKKSIALNPNDAD